MDDIGLATLGRELQKDVEIALAAEALARDRIGEGTASGIEGCAHHLTRFFNIIEQSSLRVAKTFENHLDDDRGWHAELIRRMTLEIPGIRPALWPDTLVQPLRELRAFRHVFNHAYDLTLDPDKLRLLLKYAGVVSRDLPGLLAEFLEKTAAMHALSKPA